MCGICCILGPKEKLEHHDKVKMHIVDKKVIEYHSLFLAGNY